MDLLRPDIDIDRVVGEKITVAFGQSDCLKQRRLAGKQVGRCRIQHSWSRVSGSTASILGQFGHRRKWGKAPTFAQLFGSVAVRRFSRLFRSGRIRGGGYRRVPGEDGRIICCKIVTIDTNRNGPISLAVNLSRIVRSCKSATDGGLLGRPPLLRCREIVPKNQ
jgi:hypothetical protein